MKISIDGDRWLLALIRQNPVTTKDIPAAVYSL
jgi:hypothetical protein